MPPQTNPGVGRRDQFGMPPTNDNNRVIERPPLGGSTPQDPIMAKLDHLWTALDKLESRMDANDRRLGELRPPPRPDPEPPYGFPDGGGADWDQQHRRYAQPAWGPKSYVHTSHNVHQRNRNPGYQAHPTEPQFQRDNCNLTESGSFAGRANRYPTEIPNSGMFQPLYSQPPARQPSGWDPPPHRAAQRYAAYDQPRRPPTYWDPPLYGQPPYTDMDSSYAPARQYTTSTFGQSPYSSVTPLESPKLDITWGSVNISPRCPHTSHRAHLPVGTRRDCVRRKDTRHMFNHSLPAARRLTLRIPDASRALISITIHLAARYLLLLLSRHHHNSARPPAGAR